MDLKLLEDVRVSSANQETFSISDQNAAENNCDGMQYFFITYNIFFRQVTLSPEIKQSTTPLLPTLA